MDVGRWAKIKNIPKGEAGRRLEALGLRPGKKIKKISGMPFGGPVVLMLDGRHFAISHGIATRVEVETVSEPGELPEKSSAWPRFI